ncbi:unnamed protein product [Aphis gossypii]|uniref:Uncharacterized protein n=1 Tax=Aphis gossypii TaxID=80765 RepID=A0A9P0IPX7_APHGO|nr:unnamed protein product [Aphis gossypii]
MPPRQQLQPHHPTAADTVPDFYTHTRTRAAHTQQQTIAALFSFFILFYFFSSVSLGPDDRLARSPGFPHPRLSYSLCFGPIGVARARVARPVPSHSLPFAAPRPFARNGPPPSRSSLAHSLSCLLS